MQVTRKHWYSLEVESGSNSEDDFYQVARVHHILPQSHHLCNVTHRYVDVWNSLLPYSSPLVSVCFEMLGTLKGL